MVGPESTIERREGPVWRFWWDIFLKHAVQHSGASPDCQCSTTRRAPKAALTIWLSATTLSVLFEKKIT